jgi:hypothetical protein
MKYSLIAILVLSGFALAQDPNASQPPSAAPVPNSSQSPSAAPIDQQSPAPTQATAPAQGQAATPRIAAGSVIPVQLTKTIDAKKMKSGDPVEARVTQDLKSGTGQTLMSKDTKVVGHVVEDQARSKDQKESHIAIAFDRVVEKNGGDSSLPMSIQAIISPTALGGGSNSNANSDNAPPPSSASGMPTGNAGGRSAGAGGSMPSQPAPNPTAGDNPGNQQSNANTHEPITGNTQGVVGISNLKLMTAPNVSQGAILSSDKNNVKLESGTFMLLRVAQ